MGKIRIYLDTQDFIKLYPDQISPNLLELKDTLLSLVRHDEIEIGISYFLMAEFIKDCSPEYKSDRLLRAKFIKQICRGNAYAYFSDLDFQQVFTTCGTWIPRETFHNYSIDSLYEEFRNQANEEPKLNRQLRRKLRTLSGFRQLTKEIPDFCRLDKSILSQYPLSKRFVQKNILRKFILGDISKSEANKVFRETFTDPELFFRAWYAQKQKHNVLTISLNQPLDAIKTAIVTLRNIFEDARRIKANLRKLEKDCYRQNIKDAALLSSIKTTKNKIKFDTEEIHRQLKKNEHLTNIFAPHMIEIFSTFIHFHIEQDRNIKNSDLFDILHASYIPHCDLFRCDVGFYNILNSKKIPNCEKIVPRLTELPDRIRKLQNSRK